MVKATILVIDDDENILKVLKTTLNANGFEVYTKSKSLEALEIFKNNKIDLVLLDLIMPELNGVEMYKKLRVINKDIPIILMSAYPEAMEISKMNIESLGNHIKKIQKPFETDNLLKLIKDFLHE